jgi:hypothetical protein
MILGEDQPFTDGVMQNPSCGECRERFNTPILSPPSGHAVLSQTTNRAGNTPMPIPDERLPEFDEIDEVEDSSEMLDESESDELEFESSDADSADDGILEPDEEEDAATFGYGDPAE